jgi:hypothetical protein
VKAFFGTLGSELFGISNQLTFGLLDSEQYALQVEAQGERLYNISRNLGYSDESIASGVGLGQALVGELVGTNALAEAGVGYDLGRNEMLDNWERAEKAIMGTAQIAATFAAGLKITGVNPRITGKSPTLAPSATPILKGGCFLAGTLISRYCSDTTGQKELVGIENIKSGDLVWACNPRIGTWEPKIVIGTSTHLYEGDIIKIVVNGEIIETTGTHPIWIISGNDLENRTECTNLTDCDSKLTPHGRWVNARDVQTGDTVLSRAQKVITVSNVESRFEIVQVYNFVVDDLHSYAVGITEMLVHNQSMQLGKFKTPEDAMGMYNGAKAKFTGKSKAHEDYYVNNGYTEIHYFFDDLGRKHTVPYNPKEKVYHASHFSSSND